MSIARQNTGPSLEFSGYLRPNSHPTIISFQGATLATLKEADGTWQALAPDGMVIGQSASYARAYGMALHQALAVRRRALMGNNTNGV